ncbi:MAG: UDP-N-acetylmuramate dehydrogenase [Halioglobus sp.]
MNVARDVSLRPFNTLGLEATAAALVSVSDTEQLRSALEWAAMESLPVLPWGAGSNLVPVGRIEYCVILQADAAIQVLSDSPERQQLRVSAGYNWHTFVQESVANGLFGLENLALIPGTVGAAPVQNIGAYGVELAAFVSAVHMLRIDDGSALSLDTRGCKFGYRDSIFKHELAGKVIITAVDFLLHKKPSCAVTYPSLEEYFASTAEAVTPQSVFEAVVAIRSERLPDPAHIPNAGSFFKNPIVDETAAALLATKYPELPMYRQNNGRSKLPAAWLIEKCGYKGAVRDGVAVDKNHALVLTNTGSNSGAALLALALEIQMAVLAKFGCELEIEPRVLGDSGSSV